MLTLKEAVKIEQILSDAFLDVFIDGSKEGSITVVAKNYNSGSMNHHLGLRDSTLWHRNREQAKGKILEFQHRNVK